MIATKHLWLIPLLILPIACKKTAKPDDDQAQLEGCIETPGAVITGSTGTARVFHPDPIISSGQSALSPYNGIDAYAKPATLENLSGRGVLQGDYVHVGAGKCGGDYAAFSADNNFSYTHGDGRFSDAMTYHYGSSYRKSLDQMGYLSPAKSVWMVSDCVDDNAFYYRDPFTGSQLVCMGVSSEIPNASFTDDATVAVHELQHATTVNTYSAVFDLNQLHYDEAGGLNEALSDFMSLTFTHPLITAGFDPKVFSRWALGTFYGNSSARGAHRCPAYDPSYPNCNNFPSFNSATNTVSFIYPDGMGWPYADNFTGPGKLQNIYDTYRGVEEIHNIGNVMEGALWDVYEAVRANHGGSLSTAHRLTSQLVLEALKQSPKPSVAHISPVTFRSYSAALVTAADILGWDSADKTALQTQLTERGLLGGPNLDATWATRDADESRSLDIVDSPSKLKNWLASLGGKPSIITQTTATGLNGRLDPGEAVLIWFNLRNSSVTTAGGVELEIQPLDSEISLLTDPNDVHFNVGAVAKRVAQIQYGKINGTGIVAALSQGSTAYQVPTGNSYFATNPYYYRSLQTGVWFKVSPTAAHGKQVTFRVKATPSNGATSTVDFTATIQ